MIRQTGRATRQPLWFEAGRRLYSTRTATSQDEVARSGPDILYLPPATRNWLPRRLARETTQWYLNYKYSAVLLPEGTVIGFQDDTGTEFKVAMDNPAWFPYGYLNRSQIWWVEHFDPGAPMAMIHMDTTKGKRTMDLLIYDCSLRISMGRVIEADVRVRENLVVREDRLDLRPPSPRVRSTQRTRTRAVAGAGTRASYRFWDPSDSDTDSSIMTGGSQRGLFDDDDSDW